MYADDLILIGESEKELQDQLNKLNEICKGKDLEINIKKTKCMVFSRGNKLCKANISINGQNIENVKTFKYLGFTIGAKNCNFNKTIIKGSVFFNSGCRGECVALGCQII